MGEERLEDFALARGAPGGQEQLVRGAAGGLCPIERSAWRTGASGARAGRLQEQLVRGAPGGLRPSERSAWRTGAR